MTDEKILSQLKEAVEQETPDSFSSVLLRLDKLEQSARKGEQKMASVTVLKNNNAITKQVGAKKTKSRAMFRGWVAAAALLLVFFLGGNLAYQHYRVDTVIGLDVNPSLELEVNRSEKVLKVSPLNEEALVILDEMDLKNVDLDVAVNALIGSMLKFGYLDDLKNSILITVENADASKGARLQQRISDEVGNLLDAGKVKGAVLSQALPRDESLRKLAKEHGISLGKAALINLLISADEELSFEGLAKLSINDINLIMADRKIKLQELYARGEASSASYIGEARAKQIALSHAGLNEAAITFSKAKLDYEDGRLVYEVEFYTVDKEYEYDIDAVSGQIIDVEIEQRKTSQTSDQGSSHGGSQGSSHGNSQGNSSQGQAPSTTTYIGEAKAKQIALNHAGLSEATVSFIKVEQEYEKGRVIYEVEFGTADMKYEYEIDAITGNIIEVEQEQRKQSQGSSSSTTPSNQGTSSQGSSSSGSATDSSTTESYIGEEKAIQIALNHAGFSRSAVRSLEVEREYEKGRLIYEVEFKHGGYEYEYEIDAVTGRILEVEKERD